MKPIVEIVSARASTHAHATENEGAVRAAVSRLALQLNGKPDPVQSTSLQGDAGNRIVVVTLTAKRRKEIDKFLGSLAAGLKREDKNILGRFFDVFFDVDTRILYLRLHKQCLHHGHFRLSRDDDIVHVAIKLAVHGKTPDGNAADCKAFLLDRGILA